jgi:hypothetical protein
VGNGPVDRGCAAILRKQREVDIQKTTPWGFQQVRWQNPSVRHHHANVGGKGRQVGMKFRCLDFGWLPDRQPQFAGGNRDRRRLQAVAAPGRAVRLCNHSHEVMPVLVQSPQGWDGQAGRAHKDNTHAGVCCPPYCILPRLPSGVAAVLVLCISRARPGGPAGFDIDKRHTQSVNNDTHI